MIENGKKQTSTFCHSFILMSGGSYSNLVKKSSLALKCYNLKVEASLFFVPLFSEILEKCRSVTFMIWHFEASEYFFYQI